MATQIHSQPLRTLPSSAPGRDVELPLVTLFAVPKPFLGHIGVIQRNALCSWKALQPDAEVILFGDEVGTAEFAAELGFRHVPAIKRNAHGTPLLDDIFATAHQLARGRTIVYANSDIMFLGDLIRSLRDVAASDLEKFLVIGRRIDVDLTTMVDFEDPDWETEVGPWARTSGRWAAVVCKDYFAFPRTMYRQIPAFAIGRGNWDNWMVHDAITNGVPVIDGTPAITAIHQSHDYGHLQNGRREAYVVGDEAQTNRRLAGGRHLVSGCAATWRLEKGRIRKLRGFRSSAFFGDLPRFARLMSQLLRKPKTAQHASAQSHPAQSRPDQSRSDQSHSAPFDVMVPSSKPDPQPGSSSAGRDTKISACPNHTSATDQAEL